ncbi:MAG TPA: TonB-dependent receptor, partial [Candidatus Eisenbacteria bacterium]|nr:TonB-dependent receptor [Candidatus Eisenbacteria bacterium]
VTVISRELIEEQTTLSKDLGEILGKLVPGLAPPLQSMSTFGQSLRGRNIAVLIDGVPQSTTRNVQRDLQTIDPSAIERIEVLRGPTAIYGDGATGGIINIITREPGEGPVSFTTDLGFNSSLTRPGGSFGGNILQAASGQLGFLDYSLTGSFNHTGGFFDARGDRIPPDPHGQGGLADSNAFNLFGKFGSNFGAQRAQLTINYFNTDQDTDFTTDPSVNALPRGKSVKARALGGLKLEDHQGAKNLLSSFDYRHKDLLGGSLHGQVYYRDYFTRFFPFDGRAFAAFGNNIIQSRVESKKAGSRLEYDVGIPLIRVTPPRALLGIDYAYESTSQPVAIIDPAAFDASGGRVFRVVGNRRWVPILKQHNLGLFTQLQWQAIPDWLLLRAGVRHERIWAGVDDFTTLAGNRIRGGNLDYESTLFNAGAVFYATRALHIFTNFSQGFSIPDIGRTLRGAPAGLSVKAINPKAQKVNNYELGIRGQWRRIGASLAAFYNTSDLGTTFDADLEVVRAPERVYGVEGTIDVRVLDRLRIGTTVTWTEGKNDVDRNGTFKALDGFRIPPLKLTGYVEHETSPSWRWRNRLQVLYSGSRDPDLPVGAFGARPVKNYTLLDFISSFNVGPGTLRFGIENLLNNQYLPVVSQLQSTNSANAAGRGITFSVGYSVNY